MAGRVAVTDDGPRIADLMQDGVRGDKPVVVVL
jgi:hypothetical protein